MKARLSPQAWSAVEAHVLVDYPNEACGILLGRAGDAFTVLEAHACGNVNVERSKDRYLMNPVDQLRVEKDARLRSLEVVGYYHSHPDHPAQASETDRELSWENCLYLIVSVRKDESPQGRGVADRRAWLRPGGSDAFTEVPLA